MEAACVRPCNVRSWVVERGDDCNNITDPVEFADVIDGTDSDRLACDVLRAMRGKGEGAGERDGREGIRDELLLLLM